MIIEFAESSIYFDHDVKLPIYAKAGIHEVWIVDLVSECVEIYQEPTSAGYKQMNTKKTSDTFSPASFPDNTVTVNRVLGKVFLPPPVSPLAKGGHRGVINNPSFFLFKGEKEGFFGCGYDALGIRNS